MVQKSPSFSAMHALAFEVGFPLVAPAVGRDETGMPGHRFTSMPGVRWHLELSGFAWSLLARVPVRTHSPEEPKLLSDLLWRLESHPMSLRARVVVVRHWAGAWLVHPGHEVGAVVAPVLRRCARAFVLAPRQFLDQLRGREPPQFMDRAHRHIPMACTPARTCCPVRLPLRRTPPASTRECASPARRRRTCGRAASCGCLTAHRLWRSRRPGPHAPLPPPLPA